MIQVTDYLTEAAHYIDEDSRAIVEGLSDTQLAVLIAATEEQNGGDAPGIDNRIVRTNDTLADFDTARNQHWSERGYREQLDLDAPAIKFEDAQLAKGQTRRTFVVIDFGECRIVLN